MPKNCQQFKPRIVGSELSVGNTTGRTNFVDRRLGGEQNLLFFV